MNSTGFLSRAILAVRITFAVSAVVLPAVAHAQAPAAAPSTAGDPVGDKTGTAKDVTVKDENAPTLAEVMETVGHTKISLNVVWTLLTGFLVMFMQAGF